VLLVDELPQTATGKLQRFKVRELAAARLTGDLPATEVPAQSTAAAAVHGGTS
jgi:hypothetical protein